MYVMEKMVFCNVCLDNKCKNICITCNYTAYCDKKKCIKTELLKRNKYNFLFDSDNFDTRTCYNCITNYQEKKFINYKFQRFRNRPKVNIK